MNNRTVVSTCIELMIDMGDNTRYHYTTETLVTICKKLQIESLGILYFEKRNLKGFEDCPGAECGSPNSKRPKVTFGGQVDNSLDDVMGLVRLYTSMEDDS